MWTQQTNTKLQGVQRIHSSPSFHKFLGNHDCINIRKIVKHRQLAINHCLSADVSFCCFSAVLLSALRNKEAGQCGQVEPEGENGIKELRKKKEEEATNYYKLRFASLWWLMINQLSACTSGFGIPRRTTNNALRRRPKMTTVSTIGRR